MLEGKEESRWVLSRMEAGWEKVVGIEGKVVANPAGRRQGSPLRRCSCGPVYAVVGQEEDSGDLGRWTFFFLFRQELCN